MSKQKMRDKLYVVVFLTGAIVMILELIGSRILAPNLGTSTFVWASLIGVILGAMSAGYYYGGKIADNNPSWEILARIIFISGVLVFFIIIFRQSVLDLSSFFGIKAGSVLASVALFAAPSFMLGMVSPYAVRLDIEGVENSGRTVGNLYAVSTFGSIVGTFAAGFVFIPHFGSVNILYGLAISLFAIGIFCYAGSKAYRAGTAMLLLSSLGFAMAVEAMNGGRFSMRKIAPTITSGI
jgi:predicted membrane-bound spermidine synthase